MGSVAHFTDLRSGVVDALRLLAESAVGQSVIRVGAEACEVEWDPGARHHPALLLPLVLLTAAIDEGAARARWQGSAPLRTFGGLEVQRMGRSGLA